MKNLLHLFLLPFGLMLHAQSADIYIDLESFNSARSFTVDSVTITKRAQRDIALVGGNDLKITCPNDSINEIIKKKCWAIKYHDSLFLNCKVIMKTMWYAPALYRSGNLIYFAACEGGGNLSSQSAGAAFGAIGGAFSGAARAQKRYNYLVFRDSGNVTALSRNVMKYLLSGQPGQVSRYLEEKAPDDPETIIQYLKVLQ